MIKKILIKVNPGMSDQTYEKVTTYRRNAFTVLFVFLGILTIIINSLVKHYFIGIDLTFLATLSNFFFAIALGFKLSILYDLSHPERLHKHKVMESDERTQFIRQRADALSLNFLLLLAITAALYGYSNSDQGWFFLIIPLILLLALRASLRWLLNKLL
ncbi:UNVERIFIED_ORG: hypothetical protein ABIC58_001753 [Leuconostoc holzapfelii]